jgi:hypothetical protein
MNLRIMMTLISRARVILIKELKKYCQYVRMIFVATDHNFNNIAGIQKVLRDPKVIIRDLPKDNELRTEFLKSGKTVIQITLDNKTKEERIEKILRIAKNIYIFTNDVNISDNRYFLKFDNVTVFNEKLEKMSVLKNDFSNERLIENYKQNVVTPIVCNVATKRKPLPRRIIMTEGQ